MGYHSQKQCSECAAITTTTTNHRCILTEMRSSLELTAQLNNPWWWNSPGS